MTAGAGRPIAGVAVVAALVLFLALSACGGSQPAAGRAGTAAAGVGTGQDPAGSSGALSAGSSSSAAAGAPSRTAAPRPGTATPAAHADPLSTAAASYAASRGDSVLAAVFDVRTGQSWRLGDGPPQAEASVVKLDILETLLAQRGGASLPPGDQGLAQAMIEDSDNDAATSLWDQAGGAAGLTAYNDRAGLTGTSPSPCVTCAGFAWPGWGLTTTVPEDQLTLLKQLVAPGRSLLPAAARSYALSLMERVTPGQRWGVSGGVPAGVTVALKNGWLPLNSADTDWQVNSVGWISGDGRDYLVAVLSTGNPSEQYGIDTINRLSALIWSAMR
jgi:Beta-lactamase enzyme family